MALKGFRCPEGTPSKGRTNDPQHCVHSCEYQCLPRAVLKVIADRELTNEHAGDMISATSLTSCARQLVLERTTDYYAEPRRLYWATRGALYHGFLEAGLPDVTTERRVYKYVQNGEFAPWLISGRIDYYDHVKRQIEDYKTSKDNGVYVLYTQGVKEQYSWQLNIYRWLLNGGHLDSPTGEQIYWPVDRMVIHTLFMGRVMSSGETYTETVEQASSPNKGRPYATEVADTRKQIGNNKWGKPVWKFDIKLPEVELKSFSDVEAYLEREGPTRIRGFREDGHVPAGVWGHWKQGWQCDFCDVREPCEKIEKATAVINALKPGARSIREI